MKNLETTLIAWAPIPECERGERRRAEREAVTALLRRLYGPAAELGHTDSGAPVLHAPGAEGVCISVSHSRDLAVVAADSVRTVGVDAETWRPALRKVAHKFLSAEEAALFITIDAESASLATLHEPLAALSPYRFLWAWTAKEAVFKACGSPELVLADITLTGDSTAHADGHSFSLHSFTVGEDLITLAVKD